MNRQISFWNQVKRAFNRAAKYTPHDPSLLRQIRECNSVYQVNFPLRRDDGSIEVLSAWRVAPARKSWWTQVSRKPW